MLIVGVMTISQRSEKPPFWRRRFSASELANEAYMKSLNVLRRSESCFGAVILYFIPYYMGLQTLQQTRIVRRYIHAAEM